MAEIVTVYTEASDWSTSTVAFTGPGAMEAAQQYMANRVLEDLTYVARGNTDWLPVLEEAQRLAKERNYTDLMALASEKRELCFHFGPDEVIETSGEGEYSGDDPLTLKQLLDMANEVYPDGVLADYYDEEGKPANLDETGDTLAKFIVIELAETFEPEETAGQQLETAMEKLDRAMEDLVLVYNRLEDAMVLP